MRAPNRLPEPGSSVLAPAAGIALATVVVAGAGLTWAAAVLGALIDGRQGPGSVMDFLGDVVSGQAYWAAGESALLMALVVLLAALCAPAVVLVLRLARRRTRVDAKAAFMATARDLELLSTPGCAADAARLRSAHAGPGVPLGSAVRTGGPLRATWEWVQLFIMGPRAGKTTCVCVPQILETTGPVLATSNKRDIVDLTRGPRSMTGVVWVHDLQNLIGEPPTWWWNPLTYVTGTTTADELADLFVASATNAGATQDAYFASAARGVVSSMLLAAAVGQRPITDVLNWLYDVRDDTPLRLLSQHGHQRSATALQGSMKLTERQRDGVYGTARPWLDFLRDENMLAWVTTSGPDDRRPQFDPHAFVGSTDTIYLISREGAGSARAMTGALTMATLKAAEQAASRQPGGRLATPLVAVLDEAANVCRWRELPDLYSHYGSRGIILSTFLQSWAQGVEAWGERGMQKLWGASNVRVVGPGLGEQDSFLKNVSELVGDYDVRTRTTSHGKGQRSTSTSLQRRRLLEVSDLGAMPPGRAVLTGTGLPAVLLRLDHYSTKPYAALVTSSKAYYEGLAVQAGLAVPPDSPTPHTPAPAESTGRTR